MVNKYIPPQPYGYIHIVLVGLSVLFLIMHVLGIFMPLAELMPRNILHIANYINPYIDFISKRSNNSNYTTFYLGVMYLIGLFVFINLGIANIAKWTNHSFMDETHDSNESLYTILELYVYNTLPPPISLSSLSKYIVPQSNRLAIDANLSKKGGLYYWLFKNRGPIRNYLIIVFLSAYGILPYIAYDTVNNHEITLFSFGVFSFLMVYSQIRFLFEFILVLLFLTKYRR